MKWTEVRVFLPLQHASQPSLISHTKEAQHELVMS